MRVNFLIIIGSQMIGPQRVAKAFLFNIRSYGKCDNLGQETLTKLLEVGREQKNMRTTVLSIRSIPSLFGC